MKKIILYEKKIAYHIPSGFPLINGEWLPDASDDDILAGGQTDWRAHMDGDDTDDDFEIKTITKKIEYTDEDYEQFLSEKDDYEEGRDSFYGWAMNGGGGRKEFQKMYGDGNYQTFWEFLILKI